jgi:hypothetical protein
LLSAKQSTQLHFICELAGNKNIISEYLLSLEALVNRNFRSRLVAYMREKEAIFKDFIPEDDTFDSRMERMVDPNLKEWGDDPEIEAISQFFEINVIVCHYENNQLCLMNGGDHGNRYQTKLYLVYATAGEIEIKNAKNHYRYLISTNCLTPSKEEPLFAVPTIKKEELPNTTELSPLLTFSSGAVQTSKGNPSLLTDTITREQSLKFADIRQF